MMVIIRALNAISRYLWILIPVFLLPIIYLEINERMVHDFPWLHTVEYFFIILLFILIGCLLYLLSQAILGRKQVLTILKTKHQLIQEFAVFQDWKTLITQLVKYPTGVGEVEKSLLFLRGTFTNLFEFTAAWPLEVDENQISQMLNYLNDNSLMDHGENWKFQRIILNKDITRGQNYILPLLYAGRCFGAIIISIRQNYDLTNDQKYLFENIGDELAFIVNMGFERQRYTSMTLSETVLEERRNVSRYLHDNLGHNLAYLSIRLGEMVEKKSDLLFEDFNQELATLYSAAHEAYEACRGTIESIRPDTAPLLSNLLLEHSRKVARRTNFAVDFRTRGTPFEPSPAVKQALFYVFEEAMSNIEKHAHATRVEVDFEWRPRSIFMTVHDNGVGFDLSKNSGGTHYGLEIMRERIENVNGTIQLDSSKDLGTTLKVQISGLDID